MPWTRPPIEIYQGNPLNFITGAEAAVQHNLGPVALNWQLQVGSAWAKYGGQFVSRFSADDMYSLSLSGNYGASSFRAYYLTMKGTLENPALDSNIFNPASFIYPLLAKYQVKNTPLSYLSLGYSYDPGSWFVSGEVVKFDGKESMMVYNTCGYITGGVRLGKWTPYAILGRNRSDKSVDKGTLVTSIVSTLEPALGLPTAVATAEGIYSAFATGNQAQKSQSLGLRWDFANNMDLKIQFDHVQNDPGSYGAFQLDTRKPEFRPGGSYNLITLAYDLVF